MHAVLFGKLYIVFFACLLVLHLLSPVDSAQSGTISAGITPTGDPAQPWQPTLGRWQVKSYPLPDGAIEDSNEVCLPLESEAARLHILPAISGGWSSRRFGLGGPPANLRSTLCKLCPPIGFCG